MPSWIWRYGFAFLVIALTLIVSELITPHFAFPGTLYLFAVMWSVWVGGLGPGLLASVLSTLAFRYHFHQWLIPTLREMPTVIIVFLSNILIASVSAAQRNAKESVRRTRDDLAETVQRLQRTNDALLTQSRERELAEKRLLRSEAYLTEAQRLTKTGSWAYDPTTKKALYWSDEMFRIHGLDPQQGPPTSEAFLERVHPEDRNGMREAMLHAVREKTEYEVEHRMILPDGTITQIHAHGHPVLGRSGEVVEVVGSAVDITERKLADEERERLRQVEADLARMNRVSTMGELTASLAHEIRQPLSAAVTDATTCEQWLGREQPNVRAAREAAARLKKDVSRAADIISRISTLFKKGVPQRELVDANEIVREIVVLIRGEANRYGVSMRTGLAASVPKIPADRVQLQQVLMNLMLNGIEAMKETGGVLTVNSEVTRDGKLQISVCDTGVGLPAEKADRVFDAFFTTKPQGTGMGLAISRTIVQSHGGQLWAATNSGQGAIFHLTLPTAIEGLKMPATGT